MRWLVGAVVLAGCGAAPVGAPPSTTTVQNRAAEPRSAEPAEEPSGEGPPKEYDPPPAAWVGQAMPQLPPNECGGKGGHVDPQDFDGNGKAEVIKVFLHDVTGTEYLRCKAVDFDQDGSPDVASVYAPGGLLVLEVFDFDYDQLADMANRRDGATGKMATIRDTDRDGRIDP